MTRCTLQDVEALRLPSLLRPSIEAAAGEAEALGRLPEELVTRLREAGAFRLLTPREHGGFETSLATAGQRHRPGHQSPAGQSDWCRAH